MSGRHLIFIHTFKSSPHFHMLKGNYFLPLCIQTLNAISEDLNKKLLSVSIFYNNLFN